MSRITIQEIIRKKGSEEKIIALTAYDYLFARLVDEAGVDIVLVGDSLGMVIQGHDTTLPVTMKDMLYHTRIVSRGVERALVVADMPFLSYQVSEKEAVHNAGLLIKEGGAGAVKIEGGEEVINVIHAILRAGIPVMGHIGMLPQSVHKTGGYKLQGKDKVSSEKIFNDAIALEKAGVFALVMECIPENLAKRITETINIPTIGIGAGVYCDGQVLVLHDLIGLTPPPLPKFVRRYASLRENCINVIKQFIDDVNKGTYPGPEETYI